MLEFVLLKMQLVSVDSVPCGRHIAMVTLVEPYPTIYLAFLPAIRRMPATSIHDTLKAKIEAVGICKAMGTDNARVNATDGPVKK